MSSTTARLAGLQSADVRFVCFFLFKTKVIFRASAGNLLSGISLCVRAKVIHVLFTKQNLFDFCKVWNKKKSYKRLSRRLLKVLSARNTFILKQLVETQQAYNVINTAAEHWLNKW